MAATMTFGNFLGRLFGGTSLSRQSSPFEGYGPLAAARAAHANDGVVERVLSKVVQAASFGVDEARRRMVGFLDAPGAGDFTSYLRDNLLGLERRSYGGGRPTTHLVDLLSEKSVPAASVDPSRLSEQSVARLVRKTVSPEADDKFRARAAVADAYRAKMSPLLCESANTGRAPFASWEDVAITMPACAKNRAYTVRDGVGYVGIGIGVCGATPDDTRTLMRAKREEIATMYGVDPSGIRFVFDRNMVPGTPILVDDRNLVEARAISPTLAADRLGAAFKQGFEGHYMERQRKAERATGSANVLNIADFRERFRRTAPAPVAPPIEEVFGREAVALNLRDIESRHLIVRCGEGGSTSVWNSLRKREVVGVPSLHFLPAGEYGKEDCFGMPSGKVRVNGDGAITHLDPQGREHNLEGVSFDPAPGSQEPRRWAVEGETFSRFRDYKVAREEVFAREAPAAAQDVPAPAPDADVAEAGATYRYGA